MVLLLMKKSGTFCIWEKFTKPFLDVKLLKFNSCGGFLFLDVILPKLYIEVC